MLWVLKVRNSADPSEQHVLQGKVGETRKFFWPRPPNWATRLIGGAGHERFEILVDEDVLKVSLSMCSYGGKWGKDQPIKI